MILLESTFGCLFEIWSGSKLKVHLNRELLPFLKRSTYGQYIWVPKADRVFMQWRHFVFEFALKLLTRNVSENGNIRRPLPILFSDRRKCIMIINFSTSFCAMSDFVANTWSVDNIAHLVTDDICRSWWRHQMETFSASLFVRGIHRWPVDSYRWIPLQKGQWRRALMFSLICSRTVEETNLDTIDLRRHRAHYDVIVMDNIDQAPRTNDRYSKG